MGLSIFNSTCTFINSNPTFVNSSPEISCLASLTTAVAGLALAFSNNMPTLGAFASASSDVFPTCMPPNCYEIDENSLHERELLLLKGYRPSLLKYLLCQPQSYSFFWGDAEYLRFRKDDPRDKFLFASGDKIRFNPFLDEVGDGSDFLHPKYIQHVLSDINDKFDLKFKVTKTRLHLCKEIDEASKMGRLSNVVINALSDSDGIHFTVFPLSIPVDHLRIFGKDSENLEDCFKGLDPSGTITLLTHNAGLGGKDSLAQKIANLAKRTVVASEEQIDPYRVHSSNLNNFEIFQHTVDFENIIRMILRTPRIESNNNVFRIFKPIYKNCVNVFKDKIHVREQAAIDVVKKATAEKSILVQPDEFEDLQDLLRMCKDDPRQKFLFLSMESNEKGRNALNPYFYPHILEPLSKEYDFKYKVVKSYDELCSEIKEAAKTGDLTNIVINGHGNAEAIHISGDYYDQYGNTIYDNELHVYRKNLAKCFKDTDLSKITLFSCSTNAPLYGNINSNIAHKIAQSGKTNVVAPNESIWPTKIKLVSLQPFEVYHPSECENYDNCKSDVNAFKTTKTKNSP